MVKKPTQAAAVTGAVVGLPATIVLFPVSAWLADGYGIHGEEAYPVVWGPSVACAWCLSGPTRAVSWTLFGWWWPKGDHPTKAARRESEAEGNHLRF